MKAPRRGRLSARKLAAYFERSPAREPPLRDTDLEQTHRRVKAMQRIQDELATHPRELEGMDITESVMRRLNEVVKAPSPPAWHISATALAVAAALLLSLSPAVDPAASFRAKGAASDQDETSAARVGVFAYRVAAESGAAQRITGPIGRREELMFSYLNAGERAFDYLMIFGVTADGDVKWFHPAYLRTGSDPVSIPIQAGAEPHLLREIIEHDLGAGKLTLYSLFSRTRLHVTQVESLIAQGHDLRSLGDSSIALKRIELWAE